MKIQIHGNGQRYSEFTDTVNLTANDITRTVARRLDKTVTLVHRIKQNETQEQGEINGSEEPEF